MTLEPERDNPNGIRTKLAQHVQAAQKMAALSSDWSVPYASSNAEYNILRRKFFVLCPAILSSDTASDPGRRDLLQAQRRLCGSECCSSNPNAPDS